VTCGGKECQGLGGGVDLEGCSAFDSLTSGQGAALLKGRIRGSTWQREKNNKTSKYEKEGEGKNETSAKRGRSHWRGIFTAPKGHRGGSVEMKIHLSKQ